MDERLRARLRVDTLIHDAQYAEDEYPSRRGFGHSSLSHAVAFAQTAEAGKLVLFHHDPLHSDSELEQLEQRACELWERSDPAPTLAREGMQITTSPHIGRSAEVRSGRLEGPRSDATLRDVQLRERRANTDLMPTKKTQKPPRIYRDRTTGRFVTKKYAKKHPKRTVKEPCTLGERGRRRAAGIDIRSTSGRAPVPITGGNPAVLAPSDKRLPGGSSIRT